MNVLCIGVRADGPAAAKAESARHAQQTFRGYNSETAGRVPCKRLQNKLRGTGD